MPDCADRPDRSEAVPVASPCVRLCTLNEQDVCLGCGRTLADITGWRQMSAADQRACVARAREALQQMGRPLPPYPPPASSGPRRPHSDIGAA